MIDPITQLILEQEKALDTILEGYDLECQKCGRVIAIVKDGQGPLSCCNQRMFVMGSNPEDPAEQVGEASVMKSLKKLTPTYRQRKERVLRARRIPPQSRKAIKTMIDKQSVDVGPKLKPHLDKVFGVKTEDENHSELVKSMTIFDEVKKALKGIKVDPDFMVALSDVNFSPYDQSDAQKRAEEKRKKKVSEDIESIMDQRFVPSRYDKEYMDQRQQARQELIKRQKVARKIRQKDSRER